MKHVEDPRLAEVARIEHVAMLHELMARYTAGEDYFHARTIVMAAAGPRIARAYGKDVAERAMRALCSYGPDAMPADVEAARRQAIGRGLHRHMNDHHGDGHEFTPLQQLAHANPSAPQRLLQIGVGITVASPMLAGIASLWLGGPSYLTWLGILAAMGILLVGLSLAIIGIGFAPKRRGAGMTGAELNAHRDAALERRIAEEEAKLEQADRDAEQQRQAAAEIRSTKSMLRGQASRIERDARLGRRKAR